MNQTRKELLSVRIPPALARQIDSLAALTSRDKTSVTIELLERGLQSAGETPIKTQNFVPVEDFRSLAGEVENLKKLLVSA